MKRYIILFVFLLCACAGHAQQYSARTDVSAQAYPGTIPCPFTPGTCSAGNGSLTGANYCFTPTDFTTQLCRVTDSSFFPGAANANQRSFQTNCGGSAETNEMDVSDTRFYVCDGGGAINIGSFNASVSPPTTAELYGNYFVQGCSGAAGLQGNLFFSFTQSKIAYGTSFTNAGSPAICQYDFTSAVTGPTVANGAITQLVDLSTCVAALSGVGITVYIDDVTVSADDQTFATLGSTTVSQGSSGAIYVIVWNRTNGCRVWNTGTGQITGAWGPTGAASMPDEFTLHNVRMGKGGWLRATPTTCNNAACTTTNANSYFWNISTLTITANSLTNCTAGHLAIGYTHNTNMSSACGDGHNTNVYFNLNSAAPTAGSSLTSSFPSPLSLLDSHLSMNNENASDTAVIFLTTDLGTFTPAGAWDQEGMGFQSSSPGTVNPYRFFHTYATGLNTESFNAMHGIGAVSQDGKYYFWSTDWDGMLGNLDGVTTACTIATNCRPDVFVAILPLLLQGVTLRGGITSKGGVILP